MSDIPLNKEDAGSLFVMAVRGGIASAFINRGISPTHEQWKFLYQEDMTLREISSICYDIGVDINFTLSQRQETEYQDPDMDEPDV